MADRLGEGSPLRPYVSRLAASWMAESPDARHRALEGTLVSADLSGFTAMSERLAEQGKRGAEELTEVVNRCFTALIGAAARDGGDVLKFGGDALLLWFDGQQHEVRAVCASARMQSTLRQARFRRAGLRMSVGAHSGAFDAFCVGSESCRELVLAGEPVSTTVALEAAAAAGEVVVSRDTARALDASWRAGRRGAGLVIDPEQVGDAGPEPPHREDPPVHPALVSPSLVSDLAAVRSLGGEHRMATVVFVELEGTDRTLASDGPARFAESVESLVGAVQELAARYGLLFLYSDVIADGIKLIAVAGAPASTGQDEEAALRFAVDLRDGDPHHKLRIGVNSGRVFAGFLGSPDRQAYTVMGDPVNLAARLMARAEPDQVLASETVVARTRAEFDLTTVAPFLVKGRSQPVVAHLVGPLTGGHRTAARGQAPLVGRDDELDVVRAAIAGAANGDGHVIEIVGDAGIGKTRLVEAVLAGAGPIAQVTTECQPYDALSAYAGARPLLRRAVGIPVEASATEAGRRLRDVVARVAPDQLPLLPLLAVALGATVPSTPEADAIAEEFRAVRLHETVVTLLDAVLRTATVLVVEDVYNIDDASLQLLRAVAAAVAARPWALLITRRPDGAGLVVGDAPGTLVKLQPLTSDHATRLAEAAVGDRPVPLTDLQVIVERSGGNPLFVLELLESTGEGVSAEDLPETIERLVAARIDRLAPPVRALIRQCAVLGRVVERTVIDALRGELGDAPVDAEAWRALSEFVEPAGPDAWRFRHLLYRDAAYEGLPFARRTVLHARVGALLESGVGGEPDVALLSLHFWLAGDAERTWRYSVAAGDAAWASFAVVEAIAAYRRALGVRRRLGRLDPLEIAAVAEALGDVLERAARYDEAEVAYATSRRAGKGRQAGPDEARLMRKVGVLSERTGRYSAALRWYGRARRVVGDDADPSARAALCELELASAGVMHRLGRHREQAARARRSIDYARDIGDRRLLAHGHNLAQLAVSHSPGLGGSEHGRTALALFEEVGDVLFQGKAMNNLGIEAYFRGDWDDAVQRYEAAAKLFERSGDVVERASASNNVGEIYSDQGRWEEADERFAVAERLWVASRYPIGTAVVTSNRGRLAGRRGRLAEALSRLDAAEEQFTALGARAFAVEVGVRRVEALVVAGRAREAASAAAALAAGAEGEERFPESRCGLARYRGWAAMQASRFDEAYEYLHEALQLAERQHVRFEAAMSLLALAGLAQFAPTHHAPAYDAEAARLLEQLGVVGLPVIPLPMTS